MELRFGCAFVSILYRIRNSDTLLLRPRRFYCALAVSATINVILTKISNRMGKSKQWNGGGGVKNIFRTMHRLPLETISGQRCELKNACIEPISEIAWLTTLKCTCGHAT